MSTGVVPRERRPRPVAIPSARPPPQQAARRAWGVEFVIAANAVIIAALWLRHGGAATLHHPGGPFTALGQLTGLYGTLAVLLELLLMSRIGWLEHHLGFDRMAVWHRWAGFATLLLLLAHVVFITLGYAAEGHQSILRQSGDFITNYPDVMMSVVGLAMFIAVAVTSVRAARRRLSREAWYTIHLYAYLAVALSFAHQLAVGSDFSRDRLARAWWVALYVAVAAAILSWRVGRPVVFNLRHRLRIQSVKPEAEAVVSLYITGRHLDRLRAEAGQFFLWRFLTGTGWAKAHPFSLSSAPNDRFLRITVKDLGDDTRRLQRLRPGTAVFAEGPYGTFTMRRRTRRRVVMIAGGIGITPLRAMLETLSARPGDVTLLYRTATDNDISFGSELESLAKRRHIQLHLLVGSDIGDDRTDRLGVPALRSLVPDIALRDVYLCGPPPMLAALRRRLKLLGVSKHQIHFERFDY